MGSGRIYYLRLPGNGFQLKREHLYASCGFPNIGLNREVCNEDKGNKSTTYYLSSYFDIDYCGFVDYAGLQRPFSYQFKNHGHHYSDFNADSYNDN